VHTEGRGNAFLSNTAAAPARPPARPPAHPLTPRGAAQGEGLGNAFLSHIAAVDGIFHVTRAFDDPDVIHVREGGGHGRAGGGACKVTRAVGSREWARVRGSVVWSHFRLGLSNPGPRPQHSGAPRRRCQKETVIASTPPHPTPPHPTPPHPTPPHPTPPHPTPPHPTCRLKTASTPWLIWRSSTRSCA
jgi:hypothetical protein